MASVATPSPPPPTFFPPAFSARRSLLRRPPSLGFSIPTPARIAPRRSWRWSWSWRRRRRPRGGASAARAEDGDEDAFALDERGLDLEAQMYEFMRRSSHPGEFPTRQELIEAGRSDLAEAVAAYGGWLAYGWDLGGDEENKEEENIGDGGRFWEGRLDSLGSAGDVQEDERMLQERVSSWTGPWSDDDAVVFYSVSEASSSGRSLDAEHLEGDAGIEGILSRLEKERNLAFGVELKSKGSSSRDLRITTGHGPSHTSFVNHTRTGTSDDRSFPSEHDKIFLRDYGEAHMRNRKLGDVNGDITPLHDNWRAWSVQGLGFPANNFEAGEIVPTDDKVAFDHDIQSTDSMSTENHIEYSVQPETQTNEEDLTTILDKSHIRLQLQHLEEDLITTLHSLRSRSDAVISHKERSLSDLHSLSDAWEFQENEIMKAKDKLRSIRAKLAVLEGKMTLQIIESQKIMEEKQRRLNAAENAFRLLRTACIIWPNSASEVLLAGSFDGWTTHRRMERSSSGIFSLHLKLYPGRYEFKFIVDGEWRVDPLRPIVQNNGFDNNLLVIPP